MRIAIVSDFFFPALGGAEVHIYSVSAMLSQLGHHVVIITHAVEGYVGEKLLSSGVKVFYLSQLPFYNNTSFPTAFSSLPMLRRILLDEKIQLVHGHAAFSVLAHEAILHASVLGLSTCFTDHSLFGFSDASAILTNKLLQASLATVDRAICVSYASKENTVLRAHIDPCRVEVIGNAIDSSQFAPRTAKPSSNNDLIIVFCGRLELRKGADLLVQLIPLVCDRLKNAKFVIAGDGKKRPLLEEMIELHGLQQRVELLGNVSHQEVRNVLARGDLFLNCSLTEAFCMAILEAASVGLFVVSTNVGGIPEVLPADMVSLAKPTVEDLLHAILDAVPKTRVVDPKRNHERIAELYNWKTVAEKTVCVYEKCLTEKSDPRNVLLRYQATCGLIWGKIFVLFWVIDWMFMKVLQWIDKKAIIFARK